MSDKILLGHGSGGRLTSELVRDVFVEGLRDTAPQSMDDGAILPGQNEELVFTTDSYVVSPLTFPGGDIGTLAVAGTVNDLCVMGARPLYLSLGVILEEGLEIDLLKNIVGSIARTAQNAGVRIVCGDTKVVERGKADGIFINTAGIGVRLHQPDERLVGSGDSVIISGTIGDHGMTLLTLRKGFSLESSLQSDCAPLNHLVGKVLERLEVKWMRDPTRGGVATALNELVEGKPWGILLSEPDLPLHESVEGLSEVLGLDPLYSANEGKVLMVAAEKDAPTARDIMQADPLGNKARIIGSITPDYPGKVVLRTHMGTLRTLGVLTSDPLPRIC